MAERRLFKEYKQLRLNPPQNPQILDLRPVDESSIFQWTATIAKPTKNDLPYYYNGQWTLEITVLPTYPIQPPQIKFARKSVINHPNIRIDTGEICLDILKSELWSPAWNLEHLVGAVLMLLDDPEPDLPFNVDLANLFRCDKLAFESAVQYTMWKYNTLYEGVKHPLGRRQEAIESAEKLTEDGEGESKEALLPSNGEQEQEKAVKIEKAVKPVEPVEPVVPTVGPAVVPSVEDIEEVKEVKPSSTLKSYTKPPAKHSEITAPLPLEPTVVPLPHPVTAVEPKAEPPAEPTLEHPVAHTLDPTVEPMVESVLSPREAEKTTHTPLHPLPKKETEPSTRSEDLALPQPIVDAPEPTIEARPEVTQPEVAPEVAAELVPEAEATEPEVFAPVSGIVSSHAVDTASEARSTRSSITKVDLHSAPDIQTTPIKATPPKAPSATTTPITATPTQDTPTKADPTKAAPVEPHGTSRVKLFKARDPEAPDVFAQGEVPARRTQSHKSHGLSPALSRGTTSLASSVDQKLVRATSADGSVLRALKKGKRKAYVDKIKRTLHIGHEDKAAR